MPEPKLTEGVSRLVVEVALSGEVSGLDEQTVEAGTGGGARELLPYLVHPLVQALSGSAASFVELRKREDQGRGAGVVQLPLARDADIAGTLRDAGLGLDRHLGQLEVLVTPRGAGPRLDGL